MKIIFLGEELDNSIEHELFSDNEFGFDVIIKYDENSWLCEHQSKQIIEEYHNFTEVHYLYEKIIVSCEDDRIAFDRCIHRTGFTQNVLDIESIEILNSIKLYKNLKK